MMKKIAVLCSGGVDSSVVLHTLKCQGYDVEAFYLKIWLEDELSYLSSCPWEEDLTYVKQLCLSLNVPLNIISFQKEYHNIVVAYAIDAIKMGLTPNPDMMCNKHVKLGLFYKNYGYQYDYIATGHYAKAVIHENEIRLKLCNDAIKDQTYFLAYSDYATLQKTLFPLGDFENKQTVREYAIKHNLPAAQRKDSQGICFLGKVPFKEFIQHYCGVKKGNLIEYETNKVMGNHDGFWFYTVGQRQGIGLSGGPWYVVKKLPHDNIVYISKQYYDPAKQRNQVCINNVNWLTQKRLSFGQNINIKLRHGQYMHNALVLQCDDAKNSYSFALEKNDQGIAAGQFAVLYDENGHVFGGGVICE